MHQEQTRVSLVFPVWRGRVLLVRRRRPPLKGVWNAPGGKAKPNEAYAEAAVRELNEETGLVVSCQGLTLLGWMDTIRDFGTFRIALYCAHVEGTNAHDTEEVEVRWFKLRSHHRGLVPEIRFACEALRMQPTPLIYMSVNRDGAATCTVTKHTVRKGAQKTVTTTRHIVS